MRERDRYARVQSDFKEMVSLLDDAKRGAEIRGQLRVTLLGGWPSPTLLIVAGWVSD